MANNDEWTRVGGDKTDKADETWDFRQTKEVSGKYLNSKEVTIKKGFSAGKTKKVYTLQKPDGKTIAVWGTAFLDNRFEKIEVGDEVKIIYLGKEFNQDTAKSLHTFDVMTRRPKAPESTSASNEPKVDENVAPDDIPF